VTQSTRKAVEFCEKKNAK